jgi:pyruvate kinase
MAISAHNPPPTQGSDALIGQLEALRAEIADQPQRHAPSLRQIPDASRPSAENLLHYLALRSHELGALQDGLAQLGLSSLGRSEPHVLATIDAVLHNLYLLRGHPMPQSGAGTAPLSFENGVLRLERNTEALLGSPPTGRRVRIMVTMPAEAADDYLTLHRLLQRGMDCIRINCAHDGPEQWEGMIRHLRYAERVTGRRCRVLMDLGGPKLRTGPMEPEPAVLKVRPQRDSHGQILRPARIWLTAGEAEPCEAAAADACLSVDPAWLAKIAAGDRIRFRDARKSRRNWRVREASPKGCWVEARKTAYLVNGTVLRLRGKVSGNDGETPLSEIPPQASVIRLRSGDTLLMRASERPGHPASFDDSGAQLSPGSVSLPIPEIYRDARPGESVCFDDGRISGIIEKVEPEKLHIRITHTRKPTERLASDKGVNFPETHLRLNPRTSGNCGNGCWIWAAIRSASSPRSRPGAASPICRRSCSSA